MSRLRRFLHLERARPASGPISEAAGSAAERFEGVERPGTAPRAARATGAALDRFGPEPDPPIELVHADASVRPFTRCMRCGMDHPVFAVECAGCAASLDTAAQREFNERLWVARQEQAARDEAAALERDALRARAGAELAASRRAMGEEIAREVARRERRRLGLGRGFGLPGELRLERLLRWLAGLWPWP